jgi:PAS domain S-box-containing protein
MCDPAIHSLRKVSGLPIAGNAKYETGAANVYRGAVQPSHICKLKDYQSFNKSLHYRTAYSWRHGMRCFARLRSRTAILIVLILLPVAGLSAYERYAARAAAETVAIRELSRVANGLIEAQRVLVQDVEDLLDVLALTQQVREFEEPDCGDFLEAVLKNSPRYQRLFVLTPEGYRTCPRGSPGATVNFAHLPWFRKAVETGRFVIGDYWVGPLSGQPQLGFARPIHAEDGRIQAILYAGVRLSWVQEGALKRLLPPADRFVIVDGRGTVLARVPDNGWVGKDIADSPLFQMLVEHPSGHVAELLGLDGQLRLFHLVRLGSDPAQMIYAAVGMPISAVRAKIDKEFARQLLVLALIGLVVFGVAMLASEPLIARPIRRLVDLSEHIAKGNLAVRSGVDHKAGELGELAKSLDWMAEALLQNRTALSEKNDLLSIAQSMAHIGTWIWLPSLDRLERSEELDQLLGIGHRSSSTAKHVLLSAIHPQDRRHFEETLDKICRDGGRAEAEVRAVLSDGTIRHFWCVIQCQDEKECHDAADHRVLRGVMQDISDRKRTEIERDRANRFISAMLDNISDGIVACDADGRLVLFNKALEAMHQVTARELTSDSRSASLRIYEPDGKTLMLPETLPLQRALNGECVANKEMILRPLGKPPLSVLASAQPIVDGQGARIGAVVCVRDVTEQRRTESILRQAQKLETVGRLTGGIAHDFNNLLSIVIGNLDTLLRRLKAPDERDIAQEALEGALRGAELTKQMLAFAREQRLEAVAVDAGRLVRDTIGRVARTFGDRIQVLFSIPHGLWPCRADPRQFESTLLHLAINGRDAMHDGGTLMIEASNIRITEERTDRHGDVAPGDYVRMSVRDTGSGIPPDVLGRVIEPFFTTKDPGKGSGLGLSAAYGFAKQSGGYLKVESEIGKGTAVHLYLPRAMDDDDIPNAE